MIVTDERIWAIDHGVTFSPDPLRTVVWGMGRRASTNAISDLTDLLLIGTSDELVDQWLEEDERAPAATRLRR